MTADAWAELPIPDSWTATAMLRNMVVDHLGPNKSFEGPLDDFTRDRISILAVMSQLETAGKLAKLIELFEQLAGGAPADRSGG